MKFRLLLNSTSHHENVDATVHGLGSQEEMPPSIVKHANGTGDRLLMFFYSEVDMEVQGTLQRIPAGTLRLWPHGAIHVYGNPNQTWCHSWIHLDGYEIAKMLEEAGLPDEFIWPFQGIECFEKGLERIYDEVRRDRPHPVILRNLVHTLLLEIGRCYEQTEESEAPAMWKELYDYIRDHPDRALSLAWMSRHCKRSIPVVVAEFKRYFNVSPIHFLLDCRVELARYLLLDQNLTIKEIAERCGYVDSLQFSRMFHRRTGVSPRDCRKKGTDCRL